MKMGDIELVKQVLTNEWREARVNCQSCRVVDLELAIRELDKIESDIRQAKALVK